MARTTPWATSREPDPAGYWFSSLWEEMPAGADPEDLLGDS